MRTTRIAFTACLTVSALAYGQWCKMSPIAPDICDPRLDQDPIDTASNDSYYATTDFSVSTATGRFDFKRYFVSNPASWANWGGAVGVTVLREQLAPFGRSGIDPSGTRWWHSLFAITYAGTAAFGGGTVAVRDLSGYQQEFRNPTSTTVSEWLSPHSYSPALKSRLYSVGTGSDAGVNGYHLTHVNGQILHYTYNVSNEVWFLTSIDSSPGNRLLDVEYRTAQEACPDAGLTTVTNANPADYVQPGAIKQVTFPGLTDKLEFAYAVFDAGAGLPRGCVLKSIVGKQADGGIEPTPTMTTSAFAASQSWRVPPILRRGS